MEGKGQETSRQRLGPLREGSDRVLKDTGTVSSCLKKCTRFRNLIVKTDCNVMQTVEVLPFQPGKRRTKKWNILNDLNSL